MSITFFARGTVLVAQVSEGCQRDGSRGAPLEPGKTPSIEGATPVEKIKKINGSY
jgi:hypothetical protein